MFGFGKEREAAVPKTPERIQPFTPEEAQHAASILSSQPSEFARLYLFDRSDAQMGRLVEDIISSGSPEELTALVAALGRGTSTPAGHMSQKALESLRTFEKILKGIQGHLLIAEWFCLSVRRVICTKVQRKTANPKGWRFFFVRLVFISRREPPLPQQHSHHLLLPW